MSIPKQDNKDWQLEDLSSEIIRLRERNEALNADLVQKSADLSEAKEELTRWRTELQILADQTGHNLCWMAVAHALKNTIGYTGKYPNLENITPEEFAQGCVHYHRDIFGECGVRLQVIREKENK